MLKTIFPVLAAIALAGPAAAQTAAAPPAPVRNIVQTFPASGAPTEQVSVAIATFPTGALLPFHTHPGEETGVVASGEVVMEMEGRQPVTLKAGDSYIVPRGVAHKVTSPKGEAKVIATFIVDKDKPLSTPRP